MAIGDVTPKKLFQGPLSAAVTPKYTCPANNRAQVLEIYLDNQNTTTVRYVSIYAHGTAAGHRLINRIKLKANQSICVSDAKIILNAGEVLAMVQDVGTDVIATGYGYEEVIA